MNKKYTLSIVIPTYNESLNIEKLILEITKIVEKNSINTNLFIIDDNSPDKTGDLIKKQIKFNSSSFLNIQLLSRPGKLGLASAYIQGFSSLKNDSEYLLSMDADFSHSPEYIPKMFNIAQKNNLDLVIGSRYVEGGGVKNWGPIRKFISGFGSFYAKTILSISINDLTGGYNLYNTRIFKKLDLNKIQSEGYMFQIEMKYKAKKLGYKVIEYPIVFIDRVLGKSKLSKKIIFEAIIGVIKLKFLK